MSEHPADFRLEIIKGRPQGVRGIQFLMVGSLEVEFNKDLDPPGEVVDVTEYAMLEEFGTINRALERDLLSFKTGDLTCVFDNGDGFFDDLFAFLGTTDIWSLRVYRRGQSPFWGCLIGQGSITYNRLERTVEVTAYGLTKLLDRTDAGLVRRAFPLFTVTTATGGASTLTLNSTGALLTGDVLHLTDHVNSEDVTVKKVTSATVVQLEAALAHSYNAGSEVTNTTKFHRYKTIPYLVERLFKAAFMGMAELRISQSQFKYAAPTPVNLSGLDTTPYESGGTIYGGLNYGIVQRNGIPFATVHSASWTRTFSQDAPDTDWALIDTAGAWAEWSKYYIEGSPEPPVHLRINWPSDSDYQRFYGLHCAGFDFLSATKATYFIQNVAGTAALRKRTTTDGTTWSGDTGVSNLPVDNQFGSTFNSQEHGVEYDPSRNIVVVYWTGSSGKHLRYWDIGGAAWVDMKQADDVAGTGYFGACYVADLDAVLCLRGSSGAGPAFEIAAFRGTTRLWVRPFPSCRIDPVVDNIALTYVYPTRSLRFLAGSLYCVATSDGKPQLIRSDDEFSSYVMRSVGTATGIPRSVAARINGQYWLATYLGDESRNYMVAAPFYAGVIPEANFEGLSAAEALKKLAVLSNAGFRSDDDLQGHFVARDRFDPGSVTDVEDRVLEQTDTHIWEDTSQYVRVSGNGIEATSGDAAFAAEGIEIESSLIPNEAFGQALADANRVFYSTRRSSTETVLMDPDGRIYTPLDRCTLGGAQRWFVSESDHSVIYDEVTVSWVESLEEEAA